MAAADPHRHLRRAFIGGYRVSDVEVALASLEFSLRQIRLEFESLQRRVDVDEGVIDNQQSRLAALRSAESEALAKVELLEEARADAEREAGWRIEAAEQEAVAARVEAQRIRAEHDDLLRRLEELTHELGARNPEPLATGEPPSERQPTPVVSLFPRGAAPEPALFETSVDLDAGPFDDLASLTAFEQSLAEVPQIAEIYVRSYEDGRATFELQLREPTNVIDAMASRLPYRLTVTESNTRRIVLTVLPLAMPA
jgi:hypothetical protein